jgi:dCTP deaminase
MIVNGTTLYNRAPIENMLPEKMRAHGVSYGLDESGYDIRTRERVVLHPFRRFALASSMERFVMPDDLVGLPKNKSTWARRGLDASMTTKIEPGWHGYLTIEMAYYGWGRLVIPAGAGILSIVFCELTDKRVYGGKYQGQAPRPIKARHG